VEGGWGEGFLFSVALWGGVWMCVSWLGFFWASRFALLAEGVVALRTVWIMCNLLRRGHWELAGDG
jgi:hypothetical protein